MKIVALAQEGNEKWRGKEGKDSDERTARKGCKGEVKDSEERMAGRRGTSVLLIKRQDGEEESTQSA